MRSPPSDRTLFAIAWVNVVLHLAGLTLAAVGMRPGTPLVALPERLTYLAISPIGWTLGWITWMLCAIALVTFLTALTWRLGVGARLAQLGLTIAVIGAAFDLSCDAIYILVIPMLASLQPAQEALFLVAERVMGIVSLVIANGAYSVGILLIALSMRSRLEVTRLTTGVGFATAGCGFLLAVTAFTGVPWHIEWATGPTIGLFCIWVVLVSRSLASAGRPT